MPLRHREQAPKGVFNGVAKLKRLKLHSELGQSGSRGGGEKYSCFKELEVKKNAFQNPPNPLFFLLNNMSTPLLCQ